MSASDVLATFFTAMAPIGELRVAIPLGVLTHDLTWYEAYAWAVLGNLVPVPLLLWGLEPASKVLGTFPNPAGRFLNWRAERLRRSRSETFDRWGALALIPFVAIPLPVTGAWTGCLAAWVFGVRKPTALLAIIAGVVIAGGIVTTLVELSVDFPFIDREEEVPAAIAVR